MSYEFSAAVEACKRPALKLPNDVQQTTTSVKYWANLPSLLCRLPSAARQLRSGWYIHPVPSEGNYLFYSLMVATFKRNGATPRFETVTGVRKRLELHLLNLSRAGFRESRFRREWRLSCIPELPGSEMQMQLSHEISLAALLGGDALDQALDAARIVLRQWAFAMGRAYWGGMFSVEFSILSAIFGVAIEVLRVAPESCVSLHDVRMQVAEKNGTWNLTKLTRQALFLPYDVSFPVLDTGSTVVGSHPAHSQSGWIDDLPVVRILRHGSHFDACVCLNTFERSSLAGPVANQQKMFYVLPEPYSAVGSGEMAEFLSATKIIENFRVLGGTYMNVSTIRPFQVCTSDLSRVLPHPPERDVSPMANWYNDNFIDCYMQLQRRQQTQMVSDSLRRHVSPPPRTCHLNCYIFASLTVMGGRKKGEWVPGAIREQLPCAIAVLPCNGGQHWVLAVLYFEERVLGIYDSFGAKREDVFRKLEK